jgi:hypothetical protein
VVNAVRVGVGVGNSERRAALALCGLLAVKDPARYERAALRWLERFIDERLPPLTEVALAASEATATGTWVERWQAYWIDDGPEEKLVFYCPECAEREFGAWPR